MSVLGVTAWVYKHQTYRSLRGVYIITKHIVVYEHLVGKRMSRHTTVLWAKTVEEAKQTAKKGAEAKKLIDFKILRVNTIWER